MSLEQAKHVATGLADGGLLGDDGQIMDDKSHLILLDASQVVGMSQQAEACDVGGSVTIVLVDETRGWRNVSHDEARHIHRDTQTRHIHRDTQTRTSTSKRRQTHANLFKHLRFYQVQAEKVLLDATSQCYRDSGHRA